MMIPVYLYYTDVLHVRNEYWCLTDILKGKDRSEKFVKGLTESEVAEELTPLT